MFIALPCKQNRPPLPMLFCTRFQCTKLKKKQKKKQIHTPLKWVLFYELFSIAWKPLLILSTSIEKKKITGKFSLSFLLLRFLLFQFHLPSFSYIYLDIKILIPILSLSHSLDGHFSAARKIKLNTKHTYRI